MPFQAWQRLDYEFLPGKEFFDAGFKGSPGGRAGIKIVLGPEKAVIEDTGLGKRFAGFSASRRGSGASDPFQQRVAEISRESRRGSTITTVRFKSGAAPSS